MRIVVCPQTGCTSPDISVYSQDIFKHLCLGPQNLARHVSPVIKRTFAGHFENSPDISSMSGKLCVHCIIRTCWIYNLCGSIRIYKNKISGIDPYADPVYLSVSLINTGNLIFIDPYRSAQIIDPTGPVIDKAIWETNTLYPYVTKR